MSYLTPEEKSKIVENLLREYITNSIEGVKEDIQCMQNTVGFNECHVISNDTTTAPEYFETNRDMISNGVELPPYVNDFPVYMIWEKIGNKVIFRVWAFWGDIEFK